MGLTVCHGADGPATPASTSSRAATTSGTSARSIPELDRDERILRPLNYGEAGVPGRGWGIFHAADGTEVAVINAQGRTYMQPIENPFTVADRSLDEGADELPADPPGRLPLRADEREDRLRAPPRRARQRRRRHPHPRADRRRADPAARHRLRQRPGHDRARLAASSASSRRPSCRASSTACRRASRWGAGRSSSTRLLIDIEPSAGRALAVERMARLVDV